MTRKSAGYWTEPRVRAAAKSCAGRGDFKVKQRSAYAASVRLGLLESLFPSPKRRTYTTDFMRSEALKYETRKDLRQCDRPLEQAILRRGLGSECFQHMESGRNLDQYEDTILYILTDGEFWYVGITNSLSHRIDRHRTEGRTDEVIALASRGTFMPYKRGNKVVKMSRNVARRFERRVIRALARSHKVLNKDFNPQYDRTQEHWTWHR